ncbi:MAG: hypothetical protein COU11_00940 [Candidatus Harrisonbacteria bacterium CG10_big_fil_rev_8_21_14_0_10_49_15]|uniref:Clp R domain-containing protein n=1 Tax=Candidatus Harrisonbacteria bacterium CG10_big_fil_rev_8_21_14_0_10_49_15 TaxID=1974587 RepID=A0A2H0ULN8_9BACT|nr:MAG: hypothetical protein COU11_00940 [Candidatus Harrisonbacteria bacterium CG10_big_fil_rev_8_21_14_0_10_49_15]
MKEEAPQDFYYREPRLEMTVGGRFFVRLTSFFLYGVLLVLLVVFLLSDINWMQAVGGLLVLFFLDRLVHINRPEWLLGRAGNDQLNIAKYCTPETYIVLERAIDRAILRGGDWRLYLLGGLLKRPEVVRVFDRLDVPVPDLRRKIVEALGEDDLRLKKKDVLRDVGELMKAAFTLARHHYGYAVEPHDVLGALAVTKDEKISRLFTLFEIDPADVETAFIFAREAHRSTNKMLTHAVGRRHRVMNRAWTARPTPLLDKYSTDFTDLSRLGYGVLLVGHEQEYQRLENVMSRPGSARALLVGDPGSGKNSIVQHLALMISKDRVPKPLFDKRLVSLSVGSLTAGADAGEVEARIESVLEEIRRAGNIILYIPDIHTLLRTSGQGHLSGADVLVQIITSGDIPVIGATYPQESKQYIEPNREFAAAFELIRVDEISGADAVRYLTFQSVVLEKQFGLVISFGAIKKSVELAKRHFHEALLPSSAESLLAETLARAQRAKQRLVGPADVVKTAEGKTNVVIHGADKEEAAALLNLEAEIHNRYIDQEQAVSAVADALRQYRSGLALPGGPIATFLFVGPTGVGKTELAKIVASVQFGSVAAMVRFDMTEYQDKQSITRLIGSSDGAVTGSLTESIRQRPYSLILLDEFEKAHPDILNIFLQVFDDGRLTDNAGRTVDFSNAIIIATSNAHSQFIVEQLQAGADAETVAEVLKQKLTGSFRPELLNRFSDIVVFRQLSQEDIFRIAELQLAELSHVVAQSRALEISFTRDAVEAIARIGFDPVFGARPLRRAIAQYLKNPLAEMILSGKVDRGGRLTVRYDGAEFIFE